MQAHGWRDAVSEQDGGDASVSMGEPKVWVGAVNISE